VKVSFLIPAYNEAATIGEVLDRIGQLGLDAQVIVVDDGSTDETDAVCARFGDRVRLIRVPNGGVARARNVGIDAAKGEWIALLDSDDEWAADKLAVQSAALAARPDCLWSCTGCELTDGDGVALPGTQGFAGAFPVFRTLGVSPDAYFARWLSALSIDVGEQSYVAYAGDVYELLFAGNVVLPSSALVARSVFARAGVFDPDFRLAEETEYFHRVAAVAPAIVVMAPLVRYRVAQAGSLTASSNTPTLVRNALRSLDSALTLRQPATTAATNAWRAGRRQLLLRLAYAELSLYHAPAARAAAWRVMREQRGPFGPAVALFAAGCLPAPVLRGLHAAKRRLRSGAW
jgi:GT2 family glycosyltransferase